MTRLPKLTDIAPDAERENIVNDGEFRQNVWWPISNFQSAVILLLLTKKAMMLDLIEHVAIPV